MAHTYNYSVRPVDAGGSIHASSLTREHIAVPRLSFVPCQALSDSLDSMVHMASSENGKALYIRAIETVGQHLLASCSQCIS